MDDEDHIAFVIKLVYLGINVYRESSQAFICFKLNGFFWQKTSYNTPGRSMSFELFPKANPALASSVGFSGTSCKGRVVM